MDHKRLKHGAKASLANGLISVFALGLLITSCSSNTKRGGYVSGVYDPDLDLRAEFRDQCTALTQQNVDEIRRRNLPGKRWVAYCKSCGDKEPKGPYTFGQIYYIKATKMSWYFGPDDNTIYHAARIYLEISPNRFYSLAKLIGCPTTATSTEINMQ